MTSTITINDVKVVNLAVAYAGETWVPEVNIECPICRSYTSDGLKVPQGIKDSVLHEAENKRAR